MKNCSLIFVLIITGSFFESFKLAAQDTIRKKDGTEIAVKVLEINSSEIKYKRFDYLQGPTYSVSVSEINLIKYPNGSIEEFNKSTLEKNTNNKPTNSEILNGTVKTNYPTGELLSETPYENGKINGIQKLYYRNGSLMSETPFKNGLADGLCLTHYKDGSWMEKIPYVEGEITGDFIFRKFPRSNAKYIKNKSFYKNGSLKYEIPPSNGIINGTLKMYYENGELQGELIYVNNVPQGICKNYDKKGRVSTRAYVDGEMPDRRAGDFAAALQGIQQGVALNNMTRNTNTETVSEYSQIAMNNYSKPGSLEAVNANNKVLENSQSTTGSSKSGSSMASSSTTSGKDGNSKEAKACAAEAKKEYEKSNEYFTFMKYRNDVTAPVLRYGELAKAKNAEILLRHCKQYLSEQEQAALKAVQESCLKNANDLNGNTMKH